MNRASHHLRSNSTKRCCTAVPSAVLHVTTLPTAFPFWGHACLDHPDYHVTESQNGDARMGYLRRMLYGVCDERKHVRVMTGHGSIALLTLGLWLKCRGLQNATPTSVHLHLARFGQQVATCAIANAWMIGVPESTDTPASQRPVAISRWSSSAKGCLTCLHGRRKRPRLSDAVLQTTDRQPYTA